MKKLKFYLTYPLYWYCVYIPMLSFAVFVLWAYLKVSSKIDVCTTYYSQMPLRSCFFSDYGLPPASGGGR